MSRWDLTALAVNGIIGAGIFGLPATAAKLLGYASPIAFVLCAAVVYVFVLCFAEVASYFTETGGPYLYGRAVFGSFVGFEVGWAIWLARVSAFATNSNILVAYLAFLIPQVANGLGRIAVLLTMSVVLAIVNIRGVSGGAKFGNIFAVMKVAALVLFGLVGLGAVDWGRFSSLSTPPNASWGVAILGLIYTFTGFEYAVIPAAEAKDPRKDLGWALIGALGICTLIYLAIQVVALGTLPLADLSASARPLADAGQQFLGRSAGAVIALVVCLSIIGNLSALVLVTPRLTLAFAERRDFPTVFGRLHPVHGTPVVSIVFFAVIGSMLAIYGSFEWLVIVSVVARLAAYLVTCAAAPILRKRSPDAARFRIPFGPVIPGAGILLCVWLIYQAAWSNILAFILASGAGAILYCLRSRQAAQ